MGADIEGHAERGELLKDLDQQLPGSMVGEIHDLLNADIRNLNQRSNGPAISAVSNRTFSGTLVVCEVSSK